MSLGVTLSVIKGPLTSNGYAYIQNLSSTSVGLVYNVQSPAGSPTVIFTLQESDPLNPAVPVLGGQSTNTPGISTSQTGSLLLSGIASSCVLVSWTLSGGTFNDVDLTVTEKLYGGGQVVLGSITVTNNSIGPINTLAPSSATEMGGINPTGNLQALKLDASGNLLVSGISSSIISLNSQFDPISGVQTNNLGSVELATVETAMPDSCLYPGLGGEYWLQATPSSGNLLGVFEYQVLSGYTLNITDITMPPPIVVQQFSGTASGQIWELIVADGNNPSIASGVEIPIATFGIIKGQNEGTCLKSGDNRLSFKTPIIVKSNKWILICYRVIGTGSTMGQFRGICNINGFFN